MKTATSTLINFKISSVSINLSVFSLIPKLCIFAKSVTGNLFCKLVAVAELCFLFLLLVDAQGLVYGGLRCPKIVEWELVVLEICSEGSLVL